MKKVLLFIADFTHRGEDLFFIWAENLLTKVSAQQVAAETSEIVCHDYWLISSKIFDSCKQLPELVTDIEELRICSSGNPEDRRSKEKTDIFYQLRRYADPKLVKTYHAIFYRNKPIDEETLRTIAPALLQCANDMEKKAQDADEWQRYAVIERPVSRYLIQSASAGIAIDSDSLRQHKEEIDFYFYMALKAFSAKHDMPLEVPSDEATTDYLRIKGFDFEGVNLEYILKFVPTENQLGEDLLNLQKTANSRHVLAGIPLSQRRIFPMVDWFGSITSRIYYKDPTLQNLAKQHRNILRPDEGLVFCYIDYEQYEAGIMAALSQDPAMTQLYIQGDVYEAAAEQIFLSKEHRKAAKRLFLSYAYGMKRRNLVDAAQNLGADRNRAKAFFNQFDVFERWKISIYEAFLQTGRIGTSLGNYLVRQNAGELSDKEKRSAISQVVQGTASLIFKKALLLMRDIDGVELKLPMHDAVLFQHPPNFDVTKVTSVFSRAFSEHFGNTLEGKVSVAQFFKN